MPLVGKYILGIREAITDMPQKVPTPSGLTLTAVNDPAGTIPPGTYYGVVTTFNQFGETDPSNEVSVNVVAPNNAIQINAFNANAPNGPTFSGSKFYLGTSPGGENSSFTLGYPTGPFVLTALPPAQGIPPQRNTAYLPDTDGDSFSAESVFRWFTDGLKIASKIAGGLLDYSGVPTVSGQAQYIVLGQWRRIPSMWYDGYPLAPDDAGNYFRRNQITASVLASVATSLLTDRMMVELWPQPSRSAASTTLAAPLAASDTQAVLTSTAGFLLTNGFVKIGNEVMSYAGIAGNTLKNLVRAFSGTVANSLTAGAAANELNLFFQGWREYDPTFAPGDSLIAVPTPVGWEAALPIYGVGRARLAEENSKEFIELAGFFEKMIGGHFRSNKVTTGPRQVGEATNSLEVLPSFGGGWVIP